MKAPAEGAATSIHPASAPGLERVTGRFFVDSKPTSSSDRSHGEAEVARLRQVSAEMVGRSAERPWDPVHHLGVVFHVDAQVGKLRDKADESTDCCAWVPLGEVGSLPLVPLAAFGLGLVAG
jgi:hypothetical protein